MTRFLKMSLCVVALLLVSMLVLTGCGHSKLEESINNAQTSADKAQSDAATNLATAKQAVVDATASLEAAIATKADSTTLAAEVSKLNAAIEAAKAIASTADGALKVELESAIAAAKAAVLAEGDKLVTMFDAEILALLSADQNADAKIQELKQLLENMETIAGFKADFTKLTALVASERFNLDKRYNQLVDCGLYTEEQLDAIGIAYKIADTVILRATSESVFEQAWAEFDKAVYAEGTRNVIDTLYLKVVEAEANGFEEGMSDAKALYALAQGYASSANEKEAKLTRNYYGKGDLLEMSLELYVEEVESVVSELGDRYIVNPEASQEADEETGALAISGAQDKTDLEAARSYLDDVNKALSAFNAELDEEDALAGVDETKVYNFEANETRMALLAGAKSAAEAAVALDKGYGEGDNAAVTLVQTVINDINAWDKAVNEWIIEYYRAPQENANTETQQRAALLYSLIKDTQEARDVDKAALDALATAYKDSAFTAFQQLVSQFYVEPAEDRYDLVRSTLDLSKVKLTSNSTIEAAWAGCQTWMETNDLDLYGIYSVDEKSVTDSYDDLVSIMAKYEVIAKAARDAWVLVNTEELQALTLETVMGEDDLIIDAAIKWFTDYAVWENEAIVWDTVGEAAAYNLSAEDADSADVIVTKAYYESLKALQAKCNEIKTTNFRNAEAVRNAINTLQSGNNVKLSHASAVATANTLYTAYVDQTVSAQYRYDATNPNNDRLGLTITTEQIEKLEAAVERIATLQGKLDAIDAKVAELTGKTVNTAYPYFAEAVADNVAAKTAYEAVKNALKELVADFIKAENNGGDDTFNTAELADANAAIKTAQQNIARDTIFGKNYDLAQLTAKLNAAYPYFEDAEGKVTEAAYIAALNALKDAIPENTNDLSAIYDGLTNAEVYALVSPEVHAAITAANKLLAKDLAYDEHAKLAALTTNEAYPFFSAEVADNATARDAYAAQIQKIIDAFNAGYDGEKLAWTDVQDIADAITAANELIARDIVWEAFEALKASATVADKYGYFENAAAKDAYKTKAQALRDTIYAETTGYNAVVGNTTNVADVIEALEAAELKIAKYEAFEGYYTVKYNAAVEAVNNSELDEVAKEEINAKLFVIYTEYRTLADSQTVAELQDDAYEAGFVDGLNTVLIIAEVGTTIA